MPVSLARIATGLISPFYKPDFRKKIYSVVCAIIVAFLVTYLTRPAAAVNRTWDNGGGVDTNWSNPLNWSGDTLPGPADIAVFDSTSGNATIDPAFAGSVGGIQMNAGYAGTITHASGATLSIGTIGFTQSSGTFTGAANDISVSGSFTVAGGTFTAPSGTLFLSSHYDHSSGGTFTHNNGTVTFNSDSASISLPGAGETFNNVNFNTNNGQTKTLFNGTLNVVGSLALNDGLINASSGALQSPAPAPVTFNANFDGGNATLFLTGAAARTLTFPAGTNLLNINLNASGTTINTSGSGTLAWQTLTLVAGTVNQGGVAFTFSGSYNQSGGVFNGSSNQITFNNSFAQSGGSFTSGSGNIQLNNTFTLSGTGVFTAPTGTLFVSSHYDHSSGGTFTHNNGTVTFNSDGASISLPGAGETFNNVNFNTNNGQTKTLFNGTLNVVGSLALNDGFINASGVALSPQANMVIATTFDGGNTPITFSGSSDQTF